MKQKSNFGIAEVKSPHLLSGGKWLLMGFLVMNVQTSSLGAEERMAKGSEGPSHSAQPLIAAKDVRTLPIVIVTHVDAMPPFTETATAALNEYRKESEKDEGAKRVEVLVQIGRPNHFTIVEEWADQKSYDAHVSAAHTRQFRTKLQEALGAPYDERQHTYIESAATN